jgi:hypothetical protein
LLPPLFVDIGSQIGAERREQAPALQWRDHFKFQFIVLFSSLGKALYEEYSQEIMRSHFSPMFKKLEQIPVEFYPLLSGALYDAMHGESNSAK